MSEPKKHRATPAVDLPLYAPGLVDAERLQDLLVDPDADLTPGELARIADSFLVVGEQLMAAAKQSAGRSIEGGVGASASLMDRNVLFHYTAPGRDGRMVNSRAVAAAFPDIPEHAEFWQDRKGRAASISVTF